MDRRQVGIGAAIVGGIIVLFSSLFKSTKRAPAPGLARSQSIINRLHPSIQPRAVEFLERAAYLGEAVVIDSGLRTMAEQQALYNQGRTTPGAIVTNAKPGDSWHNFGLAFDFARFDPTTGKITFPPDKAWIQKIGSIGKAAGLSWGGDFTTFYDPLHFEYHPGITLTQARAGVRPSV